MSRTPRSGFAEGDRGAVAIIVAAALVALVGFAAMAVDVGAMFEERRTLQTAADAAALAGVQSLPYDTVGAEVLAESYADTNLAVSTTKEIEVSSTFVANDTISVRVVNPDTQLFMAKVLGFDTAAVPAEAAAVIGSPSAYSRGVMPFGIMSRDPSSSVEPFGYTLNEWVRLKFASQEGTSGNFHFVDIYGDSVENGDNGGGGANEITGKDGSLENGGVPNDVFRDQHYFTETGINGSNVLKAFIANTFPEGNGDDYIYCDHTFAQAVAPPDEDGHVAFYDVGEDPSAHAPDGWGGRCRRIILCPIIVNDEHPVGDPERYNWNDIQGTKRILVVGFAYFYVEDWGTQGKDMWIDGRFIRPIEDDASSYGGLIPWGAVHYWLVD